MLRLIIKETGNVTNLRWPANAIIDNGDIKASGIKL